MIKSIIPKPGIYPNIPRAEYDSWDAFNNSGVRHILRSPKHYMHWLMSEEPDEPSDALRFGGLLDTLLLTPDLLDSRYRVFPETAKDAKGVEKPWSMQLKECREYASNLAAQGLVGIKSDEFAEAMAILQSIRSHRSAQEILEKSKPQVGLVWIDTDFRVLCKGLIDLLSDEAITDLKTTEDAGAKFSRSVNNFGYHIQGAFYSDGYAANTQNVQLPYQFIAAEKDAPYCVAMYALEPDSLLTGRQIYKKALKIYAQCKAEHKWPGYSEYVEPLEIPAYAIAKVLEEGVINGYSDNTF